VFRAASHLSVTSVLDEKIFESYTKEHTIFSDYKRVASTIINHKAYLKKEPEK
jgi:hypothetical protein